ncbi:MAG TPA: tRNA (adenosine(37)-N6)-dimethylallyltransferase MiaA [Gemmataceae bacterium]|nr:tRNA (adenosine(37)-N6)-dimethylallyltransferase MiaA [Gemmataceae bacterium]
MIFETFSQARILTGPTGCGKSALALGLAERLDAEIVSMDSMALYRRMDIGTAKPTRDQRRRVPHHLLDVLDPWESASVAWWLEQAVACCQDITQRGKRPLFVGGTPLYLKALLYGLFEGPPADEAIRRRLSEEAAADSAALHARLTVVDPVSAARLHPNDVRRVIRALEVWELTGRPISAWQTQWRSSETENALRDSRCLYLDLPRAELYARIDMRVERMIAEGLAEEVRALRQLERPLSREAGQALGYKEMFDYLDGRARLDDTVRRIQTRSRNFAKRQITWFRHLPPCRPIRPELTFAAWGLTML